MRAVLACVYTFLVHERPATRSQKLQSDLANACDRVLVDTLAALLQGGVPVLNHAHIFGPQLVRCVLPDFHEPPSMRPGVCYCCSEAQGQHIKIKYAIPKQVFL